MIRSEDASDVSVRLRDALNIRVTALFERAWPTVYRELTRMARARWEYGPLAATPHGRWTLTTTFHLLEAPAPTEIECALGIAAAAIHVEAQRRTRGVVEAWTLTFRAFADHDEAQIVGAATTVSRDVSPVAVRRLLRSAAKAGPGYYPLNETLPLGAPGGCALPAQQPSVE